MKHTIWDILESQDYSDTAGFITLLSFSSCSESRQMSIDVKIQYGLVSEREFLSSGDLALDYVEFWHLHLTDVQANSISLSKPHHMSQSTTHCLLWQYEQPTATLLIESDAVSHVNLDSLIGRLYLKHSQLVGTWLPFEVSYSDLLQDNNHTLVQAPESLIHGYQEICDDMDIQYSSYISSYPKWYSYQHGWIEEQKKFQVLLMDSSYIVASDIVATQLKIVSN